MRQPSQRRGFRVVLGGKRSDPPTAPTDGELCDGVARGDTAMAGLLYDRLIGVVDGTLCRIVGAREDDHDDLVQSAFEQILLTIMRGRFARRCSLTSWAARIATHVGLNAIRSRRRQRQVLDRRRDAEPALEAGARSTSAEAAVEARSELARVRAHLGTMDERKAVTVFLHDALGHDLGEVAELTGVTISAAQSRLVRGRRELHELLAADGPADRGGKEER